jgi:hypothetical protein
MQERSDLLKEKTQHLQHQHHYKSCWNERSRLLLDCVVKRVKGFRVYLIS